METTAVTLYRKRYDATVRDSRWTNTPYLCAHWYGGTGIKLVNRRISTDDSYLVRIFTDEAIDVQPEDVLALGVQNAKTPSSLPENALYFTVLSAVDSRRGSKEMRHWKIGGA